MQRNVILTDLAPERRGSMKGTALLVDLPVKGNGALAAALRKTLDRSTLKMLEAERFESAKAIKAAKEALAALGEKRENLVMELAAVKSAIYAVEVSGKASGKHVEGELAMASEKETEIFSGRDFLNDGSIFSQSADAGVKENGVEFVSFEVNSKSKSAKFVASKFTINKIDELQKQMYENSLETMKLGKEVRLLQEQVQVVNQIELSLRAAIGETTVVAPRRLVFEYDPDNVNVNGFINPNCVNGVDGDKFGGAIHVTDLLQVRSFGVDNHTRNYGVAVRNGRAMNPPDEGVELEIYERETVRRGTTQKRWLQHKEGSSWIQVFNRGPMEQDRVLERYLDGFALVGQVNTLVPLFEELQRVS